MYWEVPGVRDYLATEQQEQVLVGSHIKVQIYTCVWLHDLKFTAEL